LQIGTLYDKIEPTDNDKKITIIVFAEKRHFYSNNGGKESWQEM